MAEQNLVGPKFYNTPQFMKNFDTSLFILVVILVVLNVFSPLRLNTDSVRYVNIMEYLNGSLDHNSIAAHDFFPLGYPRLLQLLGKLNIFNSFTVTLINILSVTMASYVLAVLFKIENKLLFLSFTLLSFLNIKHVSLPIADQFYLLPFTLSIYCFAKVFKGNYKFLIPAILFTCLALYMRTAGVVILGGVVFYILYSKKHVLINNKYLLAGFILLVIAVVVIIGLKLQMLEQKVSYLKQLDIDIMIQHPGSIIDRLSTHFKEIGEFAINLPASKLGSTSAAPGIYNKADFLFIFLGLIAFIFICRVIIVQKLYKHFAFWVFFSYGIMIFLWPFYDTRFLIPFIPVFIYLLFPYFNAYVKKGYVTAIYAIVFILLGFVSLLYSDALSFNKNFFITHYGGNAAMTEQYKIHFFKNNSQAPAKSNSDSDKNRILYLLDKYDKH